MVRGTISEILVGVYISTAASVSFGQLVFAAPSGGANGLFQQSAGTVSAISSGLTDNGFPSTSRDGRFVVVSGPDPAQPSQASTDLWLIDRVAQTRVRIVNHSSTNLPDGSVATVNPQYNALRADNTVVAVTDQILITSVSGNSVTPQLNIYRVSDGFYLDLVEIGQGNALDLTRSEFVGISWKPDGTGFATPAYANFTAQSGATRALIGIILFSYNPVSGTATRQAVLSAPRYYDLAAGLPSETHIYPVFSPDGTRLAYFEIFWPNALLSAQATATLMTANADGSGVVRLLTFPLGQFPMGLTWSPDGSQLIYARGNQVNVGGTWVGAGDPATAVIRSIKSVSGGPPTLLTGVNAGSFPNYPPISLLSQSTLEIAQFSPSNVLIRMSGLPGSALYGIQSSTDMDTYGVLQNFTGAQYDTGVLVTPSIDEFRAFRLVE